MRKSVRLLFAMATVIGISTGNQFADDPQGNVVYASSQPINTGEVGNNSEKFKADFAYEMAQITAKIIAAPSTNVETFKVEYAYAIAKVTAKVMPMIPSGQRNDFAYAMAQITTKILSDPNLSVEKAKAEFAYEIAQLTTKIITNADYTSAGNSAASNTTALIRNNADIESKVTDKTKNIAPDKQANGNAAYIAPETYTGLISELTHVGDGSANVDNKVNFDGEVRYHYALNSGANLLGRDSSGIRARIGFDTALNKDWRAYGMLEGQKSFLNYNNEFELSRLYVTGKLGSSLLTAGSFGYLMAEGNIYDSGFKGVRADFGRPVKYTLSYGQTDDTKDTTIATARYEDYDYNLEAGIHHYKQDDGTQNTIRTLGGNYNFSNFSVGAMLLDSSLKSNGESTGYVFSLNYGDLKSWRAGTYGIFAKYYNQPRYTYIAHGMNGRGGTMADGFKGYSLGMSYTLAENLVAGTEYYGLTDKVSGEKGNTWWNQITRYF